MSTLNNFNLPNFKLNNFNSLIAQAREAVMCDSNCQKQKTAEELKQKYLASKTNLDSAPAQVDLAKKNYVTFTQGELAYNNEKDTELHRKAQLVISQFNENFNNEAKQITFQIDSYNGLTINFNNVVDLYLKYKKENIILSKKVKDSTSDVLTNERKTYYENQGIDTLKNFYHYILLLIYGIFVIGYIATAVIYPSQINWKYRFLIVIVLLLLPIISPWILGFTINFIYKIYNLLPKNVHLTV